jgi:hypothetical protein
MTTWAKEGCNGGEATTGTGLGTGSRGYSLNNLTATPDANGNYVIQFGGCKEATRNCLPIMKGWNYTVRLYRPRKEIVNGSWKLPKPEPVL